jgi:hypothetical protein
MSFQNTSIGSAISYAIVSVVTNDIGLGDVALVACATLKQFYVTICIAPFLAECPTP